MSRTADPDSARRDMAERAKRALEEDEQLVRQCRELVACIRAVRDSNPPPNEATG